jgi:hypothetical protein
MTSTMWGMDDVTEDRKAYAPKQPSLLAISRVLEETARMLHIWALADDPSLRRNSEQVLQEPAAFS